jgi:O-antigen/teichoic acid export membrane protein
MLLARLSQILFAPLSDVTQLGLYAVAVTISDVPLIVAIAIRDAVYGISSKSGDANQVTTASRLTLLLGVLGSLMLGATLPIWIGTVFGHSFAAAVMPTWILMLASVINIPGFLAAAGLGAWGRPGLRSIGLAMTLVVNLGMFVALVPSYGALGGAMAGLCSAIASTTYMVSAAARVLRARSSAFLVPTRDDLIRLWVEGMAMLRRLKLHRHERVRTSGR